MFNILSLLFKYFGYDLTKSKLPFKYYKGKSNVVGLDFHPTPIGKYYLPSGNKSDGVASHMKRGIYFEKEVIEYNDLIFNASSDKTIFPNDGINPVNKDKLYDTVFEPAMKIIMPLRAQDSVFLIIGIKLNTVDGTGGRFITINIKKFDENLNLDRMLYMLCDPSFYSIKLLSNMQCFLQLYGDQKDVGLSHWHSVQYNDLRTPVGATMMMRDLKLGNTDVMYYFIHQLENPTQVKQAILDIVLNAENENMKLRDKATAYAAL